MAHINIRDLGRVSEITTVLARHGFGHLVRRAGLDFEGEPIEVKLPIGRRIRMVLSDLGPTFVKLGQILSVRPDIVPPEVIVELAALQDNVPAASFEAVREVVETELGASLDERFSEFDAQPVASASIAQVHRAVLLSGEEVAVKVQRPHIEARIRSDLHILHSLAQLITGRIDLPGMYTPVGVVHEFEAAIYQELDFLQEARSAIRFAQNFRDHDLITAPQVYRDYTTRRMMVMEMIRGTRWLDLDDDPEAAAAAMDKLIEATYLQVFEYGFFHGDPHPGNLIVREDGRLCYLDFGITGVLTGEMQDVLVNLFLALVFREPDTVALTLYRAGATDGRVDLKAFRREIERLMAKYHGATMQDFSDPASLMEFVQVAGRYRIRLVPEYAVLARATSILDGLARKALPDTDIVEKVRPYAQRLLTSRLSTERLGGDALRLMQHVQVVMRDVPVQLNQLLVDLERGRLSVQTVDPDIDRYLSEIQRAAIRMALALICSALAVSGALLIAPWDPRPWGIPIQAMVGGLVGTVALTMFVGLTMHFLVAARLHPREWRRRAMAVWRFLFSKNA